MVCTTQLSVLNLADSHMQALHCLPENLALAVLRASVLPLPCLLARLPPSTHALVLLATHPSIDYTASLSLPIMAPYATRSAICALSHFPHLSALRFYPWMPPALLLGTLHDLQALSNILSLDMSCMHVSLPAAGALASALWRMPQLQALDLSNSALGATGAAVLLPVAASMHALRTLLLSGCGVRAAGTEAQCMPLSSGLRKLSLSRNQLGDRGARALAMALAGTAPQPSNKPAARHAHTSTQCMLEPLRGTLQLEWLDVSNNGCSTEGLLALADAVTRLPCVHEATLLDQGDIKSLPGGVLGLLLQVLGPHVACFRKLSLGGNSDRLSDMHVAALSPLLCPSPSAAHSCMPTLRELDLSYVELSIERGTALAHTLRHARALQSLNLACCYLEDEPLEAVLLAVSGASLLATLDLRGNVLQMLSCAAAALVVTLPTLVSLTCLSLCISPDTEGQGGLRFPVATGAHITTFRNLLTPCRAAHCTNPSFTCPVTLAGSIIGRALCGGGSGDCEGLCSVLQTHDMNMLDDACSSQRFSMHAFSRQASSHSFPAPLATLYLQLEGLDGGHEHNPAVERSVAALVGSLTGLRALHLEHALTATALSSLTGSATHCQFCTAPLATHARSTMPNRSGRSSPDASALTALTSLSLSLIDDDSSAMGMDRGLKGLAALICANSGLQGLEIGIFSRGSGRVIGEGAGRFAFSRALNNLASLRHLDLCEEICDEEFMRATFMRAKFLSVLRGLRLSVDGQCKMLRVAEALAHGRALQLRTLHLHGVHVSHACAAALLQYVAQGSALEELGFDSDWITEGVASQLAPAIGLMQCLQVLCFARNPIRDRGAAEIARQLPRLQSLRSLSFCCCHISSAGVAALSDYVTCLTRLQAFRLSGEFVGPMAMSEALAPALATLGALSVLQLHDNHIGDEGAAAFGRWLQGHAALCQVSLTSNDVMDAGALALVRCFKRLPALQRVNVTGNRFGARAHAEMAELQASTEDSVEVHW